MLHYPNKWWFYYFSLVTHSSVFCVGGHAPSSGCLRCVDSPEPQAGTPARAGSRPSRCHLQQGHHDWHCVPVWRGSACHRLQPRVPLPGRAQGESCLLGMLKGRCVVNNVLLTQDVRKAVLQDLRLQVKARQFRRGVYILCGSSSFLAIKTNHVEDKCRAKLGCTFIVHKTTTSRPDLNQCRFPRNNIFFISLNIFAAVNFILSEFFTFSIHSNAQNSCV